MEELKLGTVELQFANIIWAHAPVTTKELVGMCGEQLNWQRTTTYTVLKKLCDRGMFVTENSTVKVLISRDEFYALQSQKLIEEAFGGSLPAFIAAFAAHKPLSKEQMEEISRLMTQFGKE